MKESGLAFEAVLLEDPTLFALSTPFGHKKIRRKKIRRKNILFATIERLDYIQSVSLRLVMFASVIYISAYVSL